MSCLICDEKFNKTTHTSVQCQYCEFSACRKCCETYILDKTVAICMNNGCKKEWTRKYMKSVLTSKFLNGAWKANLENILFEREKALLPATQEVLKRIIIAEKKKEKINDLNKEIKEIRYKQEVLRREFRGGVSENVEFTRMCSNKCCKGYLTSEWVCVFCEKETCFKCLVCKTEDHRCNEEDIMCVKTSKKNKEMETRKNIKLLQMNLSEVLNEKVNIERTLLKVEEKVHGFTRGCPYVDCRGFLDTEWLCGLCSKRTCKDCHLIKTEDHECNKDDIATAKLLKSDTKSCPKCGTCIYKIDGCDQMWCTQCHTAFSWKTGNLETAIHNPHYFEWQRRNGRNLRNGLDIICGREINHQLSNSIRNKLSEEVSDATRETLDVLIQNLIYLRLVSLAEYRVDEVENNEKLRIGYLRKELNEDDLKKKLQKRKKLYDKKREVYEILTMFVQMSTDIFHRLNEYLNRGKNVETYLGELEVLRVYTNECLEDIGKTYHQKDLNLSQTLILSK